MSAQTYFMKFLEKEQEKGYNSVMFKFSTKDRQGRHRLRHLKTIDVLKKNNAHRILDIGCAEGKLIKLMAADSYFTEIVGIDPDADYLAEAKESLGSVNGVRLVQESGENLNGLFKNYDAVTLVEVIEHISLEKLPLFTENIFGHLSPRVVVVTTPVFFSASRGESRTREEFLQLDHYFEWTSEQFSEWVKSVGKTYGYKYEVDLLKFKQSNRSTQMAVFNRND